MVVVVIFMNGWVVNCELSGEEFEDFLDVSGNGEC